MGSYEQSATFTRVVDVYHDILALPCLFPSPVVNKAFTELVFLCLQIKIPSKYLIQHLQDVCRTREESGFNARSLMERAMEAEACMERCWAEVFATCTDINAEMRSFWYWDNYAALTRYELDSLAAAGCTAMQRIAFIGSGPLPLSAILVGEHTKSEVVLYDRDAEANVMAAEWVRRLPAVKGDIPAATYSFRDLDVSDERRLAFAYFDVVWVAASVGANGKEKRAIVDHLKSGMRPGTFVAVRSAEMGCSLLYPEVEQSELVNLNVVRHDVPPHGVVNSVIILRI